MLTGCLVGEVLPYCLVEEYSIAYSLSCWREQHRVLGNCLDVKSNNSLLVDLLESSKECGVTVLIVAVLLERTV